MESLVGRFHDLGMARSHGQRDGAGWMGIQGEAHDGKRHVTKDGRDAAGQTPGNGLPSNSETTADNLLSTNWAEASMNWSRGWDFPTLWPTAWGA